LREALLEIADVVTVAPLYEQSANSHSLTLARPLRHRLIDGIHAIDGTPADCIYIAVYGLMSRRPDLAVSGINHGYNLATDTFYSGTVAAAREAALRGIPALAFSLGPGGSMEAAAREAVALVRRALAIPRDPGVAVPLLNVNFPGGRTGSRGVRTTRLGQLRYDDKVVVRVDPRGDEYYWIGGPNALHEPIEGSDTEAVDAGYTSVTPLRLDHTSSDQFRIAAFVAGEGELP
jgi:5'-nucleotidase